MSPDLINGLFEFGGALFNAANVVAVYRAKAIKGVFVAPTMFFTLWGLWNLFYYPHLEQWWSFAGGLAIVTVNATWVVLAIYYTRARVQTTLGDPPVVWRPFIPECSVCGEPGCPDHM